MQGGPLLTPTIPSVCYLSLQPPFPPLHQPINEPDRHRRQQPRAQDRRPVPLVVHLPPHPPQPDCLDAQVVQQGGVDQRGERDGREGDRCGGGEAVAEVEQRRGDGAEDDAELEPGEEGALVGEEDLGFDACGEGDALACGRGRRGQRRFVVWRRGIRWREMLEEEWGRVNWARGTVPYLRPAGGEAG